MGVHWRSSGKQLTGQILLGSQEMHSDALRLQTLTDNSLSSSQRRIIIAIFLAMAIATVPLTLVLFQIRRSIGQSLTRLRRGPRSSAPATLDHRIGMSRT